MQLHPLQVSSYTDSVYRVIEPILSIPEDVDLRWYDIQALLMHHVSGHGLREHIGGYTLRMTYTSTHHDQVVFPIGIATLPWNGGRVSVRHVGRIMVGGREHTLPYVMILVGPSGWYYIDDAVDKHTHPLLDSELDGLPNLLKWHTREPTITTLEGDPDQTWGQITSLSRGWERLFYPTPSELMQMYRLQERSNLQLVVQWERTHARWLHHTQRLVNEDLLHDYLPTPIYFINDEAMPYRQALMFGIRWWGYTTFLETFSHDPYLTYMTWYWSCRLLQSHRCQEILKTHPEHTVIYITHITQIIEGYFLHRRNGQRDLSYKRFESPLEVKAIDYTPISILISDYLSDVLDRFQFEGFTK